MQAEANGELTIKKTEIIVNVPIITWTAEDGQNQTASTIDRPFESMPGFDILSCSINAKNRVNEGIFIRQLLKTSSIQCRSSIAGKVDRGGVEPTTSATLLRLNDFANRYLKSRAINQTKNLL